MATQWPRAEPTCCIQMRPPAIISRPPTLYKHSFNSLSSRLLSTCCRRQPKANRIDQQSNGPAARSSLDKEVELQTLLGRRWREDGELKAAPKFYIPYSIHVLLFLPFITRPALNITGFRKKTLTTKTYQTFRKSTCQQSERIH